MRDGERSRSAAAGGWRRFAQIALVLSVALGIAAETEARGLKYGLTPDQVADGVYVFWGLQESWNTRNGGNIVNTGFIVGERAVLAVDTGTTRFYAEEMIGVIRSVTDKPIRHAVVTHHHPDHSFGIKQFKRANARVMMHPEAKRWLLSEGPSVIGNMEIYMGQGWLAGTEIDKPNRLVSRPVTVDLGGRRVIVQPMVGGHTAGDLIVLDEKTGALFVGDLVFNGSAPTVPHAYIPIWLDHLRTLARLDWTVLIPGHGPLVREPSDFALMEDYLKFLQAYAADAVARGETLAETLDRGPPSQFDALSTLDVEFPRSLPSLFRKLEADAFDAAVAVN